MSYVALLSSLELGLTFGLVAIAVYISFRVLDFPDLTVDGSFATGAAVTAACITQGLNPWLASLLAMLAGGLCGLVTALLNRRFGMLHLLAGILTTIGLFSIDLRIMGRPNVPLLDRPTVFSGFAASGWSETEMRVAVLAVLVLATVAGLAWLLHSQHGLALRAIGANPRMARAQGVNVDGGVYAGLALSNGLAALDGAIFTQSAGFADVGVGGGSILFGLAAVILGEALLPSRRIAFALLACVLGSVLYRIAVGLALNAQFLGLRSSDLRLVTAVLVALAFVSSRKRRSWRLGPRRRKAGIAVRKKAT
jgi:putative ABC transport system permease protein